MYEPNDDFYLTQSIQKGIPLNGYIQFYSTVQAPPDADIFTFRAFSNETLSFSLDLHNNSFLDLILELYRDSNLTTPVRWSDNGGYGGNEQINYGVTAGTRYFIKVYEKNKYIFDRSQYYTLLI